MRILVQDKATSFYFKKGDAWTAKSADAFEFPESAKAVEFCESRHLSNVRVIETFSTEAVTVTVAEF